MISNNQSTFHVKELEKEQKSLKLADERAALMLVLRGWGKGTWPEHNTLGKVLTVESTGKKASHIESTS